MFNKGTKSLRYSDVLDKVSEFDILAHYLGITEVPCLISSPLREDNHPSFGVYSVDGIKLRYKDFRTHENGGVMDILPKIFKKSFIDTVKKIYEDIPKIKSHVNASIDLTVEDKISYSEDTEIECKIRKWNIEDKKYWFDQYGINVKWLEFGNVFPISHIIINKKGNKFIIPAEKNAYAYAEFKDGKTSLKIYQPYSRYYKWRNKIDSSTWDLWEQLPEKGDKLIITSSRKDALTIWANTGIPACSLQAESCFPKKSVMEILKRRFKNIYILYDNDFTGHSNWGRILGRRIANEYNLKQLELPEEFGAKDSSDFRKLHGRKKLKETINKLIINFKN